MTDRATSAEGAFWSDADDREALERHRALLEAVDDSIYQLDATGRFVAVNEAFVELTGYSRAELLGADASLVFDCDLDLGTDSHSRSDPDPDPDLDIHVDLEVDVEETDEESAAVELERGIEYREAESEHGREREVEAGAGTDTGTGSESETETGIADAIEIEGTIETADGWRVAVELRQGILPERTPVDGETTEPVGIVRERAGRTDRTENRALGSPPGASESIANILHDADIGVFVLDESFEVVWVNETSERYFGIDREAVLGGDKRRLIDETFRNRIADAESFADAVLATYEDNSYAERFECRVTAGEDRAERWLEHRSKPIESGPYAGGRVELYYDVTAQHRRATQLRRLNEAVGEWLEGTSREGVAERACDHLAEILDLELNGIFLADAERRALRPVAWTDPAETTFGDLPTFARDEGIAWRVFESGEPAIYDDVTSDPDIYNRETPIRSEIVLPIGDHGVLIAGSRERGAFDDGDLMLAEIAASSIEVTFDRIRHERQLERERAQTEKLLETAPIAISVEDAAGETVLANHRAQDVSELFESDSDSGSGSSSTSARGGHERGSDAAPETSVDADSRPAARVRSTGEPVFDEEITIAGGRGRADAPSVTPSAGDADPASERRWFSVSAAPLFGADGDLERVITVGEDVTALKERERELESELSEILGRVSDAFYALDEEFRFTHVNERAEELLQRSADELLGERIWEAFPEAADEPIVRESFRAAMETQEPVNYERYVDPLEFWIEATVYPSETGVSVYFRDVSDRKARERELELYERIVETVGDGVYAIDEDARFVLANEAFCEMVDWEREDLLGEHATAIYDDEIAPKAAELAAEVESGVQDVASLEFELRTSDGAPVPVESRFGPFEYEDGTIGRTGVVRDVSERLERERALEESERRYRTLAEQFPNGMVTLYDEELRYTLAAGRAFDDLPVSEGDLEGNRPRDAFPEDVAERLESAFRAAFDGEERAIELEYAGREWGLYAVPIVDQDDEVFSGLAMAQDITERKETRRRLEESERRYRRLVENFPNGVVALFDEELRYTAAGGGLLTELGIDRETVIGEAIRERYPDDLATELEPHFRAALDGEERSFEVDYYGRNLRAHTLPIETGAGATGMLVVRDVTERREYQRKLEESNERLEQFAYAASHDLQEPLRMVTSYLRLIERRYEDELDEDGREFIEFAVDGAERMRTMIEALLEYSRVESEGEPLEPVDLASVLDDVRKDLEVQIEESGAEIAAEPLPAVRGDVSQLRQLFQNLLSNALEYSGDEPPRVRIGAERDGSRWIVSVRDDGIGIDPEDRERIFEVFQRLHSRDQHEGTGIGLALCQRIVERHDGEIWVDSEPGEGSTFSVTLPAATGGETVE